MNLITDILKIATVPGTWLGRYFKYTHFILGKDVSRIVINCENELVYQTVVSRLMSSSFDIKIITDNEFRIDKYTILIRQKQKYTLVNFDLVEFANCDTLPYQDELDCYKQKLCKFLLDYRTLTSDEVNYMRNYNSNGWKFQGSFGECLILSGDRFVVANFIPLTIGDYSFDVVIQKELTPELAEQIKKTIELMLA